MEIKLEDLKVLFSEEQLQTRIKELAGFFPDLANHLLNIEIKTGRNKHVSLVKRGGKGGRRGRGRGKTKGEKRSVFDDMYECFLTKRLNINDN